MVDGKPAVRARAVTKSFGPVIALDAVDVDVPPGQVHGLVGPNGAGKSTLLGLLLGLAVADSGRLEVLGCRIDRRLAVPDGVTGFVDGPGLYASLTARQNLAAVMSLRGRGRRTSAVEDALEQVGLASVADDRVGGFSLGMRQRLGLAVALLARPQLLVLDEPANGLDAASRHHVHRLLGDLAAGGTAVVLSSHRMDDLAALCDEVTILRTGRVVFSGPVAKLAAETGNLAYRVVTSDPELGRQVASRIPELHVLEAPPSGRPRDIDVLLVRGPVSALDALVARLVAVRVGVRELAPVVSPLEAAFLNLTDEDAVR